MLPYLIFPAFLAFVLLIPIGLELSYNDGLCLYLRLWRKLTKLFPKKKQEKSFSDKNNKKQKLSFNEWPDIINTVRIVIEHLGFEKFKLHYTSADADPYTAVINYSRACAIVGAVFSTADAEEKDVQLQINFESEQSTLNFELSISARFYQLFEISFAEGAAVFKFILKHFLKQRKAVHGKQTK